MEAVNIQFAPATGTDQEWNEAYARLADYFRSYRLHNRIRRTQLVLESLRRASVAHQKDTSRKPVAYAIEEARQMMHDWLGRIYHDMHLTPAQIEAGGRLGFYISDGPDRWPLHFMDTTFMPPEMSEAMRQAVRTSGPSLQVSKMTPRDIDLGFTHVAEGTFEGFARQPWMRYALLAIVVATVFAYAYKLMQ
ncbi:MAG: hypothetical protein JNG86_20665 [Verrucomicrobiaceae bacterium]|nr:hypothetical protein [Verrucomicrobiaceae bacterium]